MLPYTNNDIMSFSRACTGFELQSNQGNIESTNRLDPMKIVGAWRDKFPKTGTSRGYIGDPFPVCVDYP